MKMIKIVAFDDINCKVKNVHLNLYQYIHFKLFKKAYLSSEYPGIYIVKCKTCNLPTVNYISGRCTIYCGFCHVGTRV